MQATGASRDLTHYKAKKYQHYLHKHQLMQCLQDLESSNQRTKKEAKHRLEALNGFTVILESLSQQRDQSLENLIDDQKFSLEAGDQEVEAELPRPAEEKDKNSGGWSEEDIDIEIEDLAFETGVSSDQKCE